MDWNRRRLLLDEDDDLGWLGIEDAVTLDWLRSHIEYESTMPAQWWPARRFTPEQLLLLVVLLDAVAEYVQTFEVKSRREWGHIRRRRELWRWFHHWPAPLTFRMVYEGLGIDPGLVYRKLRGVERGAG